MHSPDYSKETSFFTNGDYIPRYNRQDSEIAGPVKLRPYRLGSVKMPSLALPRCKLSGHLPEIIPKSFWQTLMDATALFISETEQTDFFFFWDITESVLEGVKKRWGNADGGVNQHAVVHHAP